MSDTDAAPRRTNAEIDAEMDDIRKTVREGRERLAALRRERTPEPVEDYALGVPGGTVRLSELFGDKQELVVVHNMGRRCPMCTTWADGLNGVTHHVEDRMAFAVSSPDTPDVQAEFAASRDWRFRMVSTAGTSFAKDLGMEGEHEGKPFPYPGLSVFRRTADGGVERLDHDFFGPGDVYCVVWSLLDLLPDGQGDWWPKLSYE